MGEEHDVVVIGAGFSGIYAVHKMRDELGLDVRGFEATGGVGGAWWWNRYPGARCDFESIHYSYSFSEELQREWEWSERFAPQEEILSYLEWVADKLDVRRSFQFDTRVTALRWDEADARWTIGTDDGFSCTARYVLACVGGLSLPKTPEFSGLETFEGELYFTSSWPHHEVDFAGKRVAVVGTGSSGLQVVPEIGKRCAHLTVFQRTPNYAVPLRNGPVDPESRRWKADNHAELRAGSRDTFAGIPYPAPHGPALAFTPEQRRAIYDKAYELGGIHIGTSTFTDLLLNPQANETLAAYLRERIRERVQDPATADLLVPDDHPWGTKRPTFETGYYETFNQPHVELVDVRSAPIEEVTPAGIRTSQASFEFDMIVLATGFDVYTGSLLNLNITGRGGLDLREKWANGPRTYLGLQVAEFPNLFTITGPQSPIGAYNTPLLIEDHINYVTDLIKHLRSQQARTVEAAPEAEQAWHRLLEGQLAMSLYPRARGSWYMGDNIPGKPRAAYLFISGAPLYRTICADAERSGYGGFVIDHAPTSLPPTVRLDPAVGFVLGGMLAQGFRSTAEFSVEATRAQFGAVPQFQTPGPEMRVEPIEQPHARVYVPDGAGPFPVVVFIHGGGWVAGSVDVSDAPSRNLAARLGAVVVAAGYRLAPEHPFPAATDDTFAVVQWVRENIEQYGGDPDRIAVVGESAGGNLAAVAALRARDAGIDLTAQVLINPPIDPDVTTESQREFATGPFISHETGQAMWAAYLAGAEVSALAAPMRAGSLAGLPPTLVITMELDPLRDEAEDYARALEAAGVAVDLRRFDGLFHGVSNMGALVPRVQDIDAVIGDFLASRLGVAGATGERRDAVQV